ncbi:MAG TPA: LysR family transcriptional regulator [Kofleriaceae bacterium]|nr:LysR family transcriptional regulator [Kofleriaceae bacterium]
MQLNYHHLFYFWTIAREGTITRASKALRVSHPTLSSQLRLLEAQLSQPLFDRMGKRLVLTEAGRVAFRYSDEIFSLGSDLTATLGGRPEGKLSRIVVGVAEVVPKLIVRELLAPLMMIAGGPRLVCVENSLDRLLGDLSTYALDVVIADSEVPTGSGVKAHAQLLGRTAVSLFGAAKFAALRKGFPRSLAEAPFLLPLETSTLRREMNHWFESVGVTPSISGEFGDSALLKLFGARGLGVFPAPTILAKEVTRSYNVIELGKLTAVSERYYAITMQRKITNPAIATLVAAGRKVLAAVK